MADVVLVVGVAALDLHAENQPSTAGESSAAQVGIAGSSPTGTRRHLSGFDGSPVAEKQDDSSPPPEVAVQLDQLSPGAGGFPEIIPVVERQQSVLRFVWGRVNRDPQTSAKLLSQVLPPQTSDEHGPSRRPFTHKVTGDPE